MRIFSDERGSVAFPLEGDTLELALSGRLEQLHTVTLTPGAVRGNHLHPDHEECIVMMGDGLKLFLGDDPTPRQGTELVRIAPGVPHAIVNEGTSTGFALCFYGPPSDKEVERIVHQVIKP